MAVTNDVHSTILSQSEFLYGLVDLRSQGYVVADSGDFFEGTLEYDMFGGVPETRAIRQMYDIVAPGNHGFEHYVEIAAERDGPPVVSTNLKNWPGPPFWNSPDGQFTFMATIGRQAFDSIVAGGDGFEWTDPLAAVEEALSRVGTARTLVILSHQGFAEDVVFAEQLNQLSIRPLAVFSGHCHTDRYTAESAGIRVIKGPEMGRGYAVVNSDGSSEVHQLKVTRRHRRPHPLVRKESYEFHRHAETRGHLSIPRSIASDREELLAHLADRMTRLTGSSALLNLGAVRGAVDLNYPWCSADDFGTAIPFTNKLVEVETSCDPLDVLVELTEQFGEESILVETDAVRRVVTTSYMADRIGKLGRELSRTWLDQNLTGFARSVCFVGM